VTRNYRRQLPFLLVTSGKMPMSPRAIWKGSLKIAELSCPVALHAAASTSDRVSFRMVSRRTGHPLRRQMIDEETEAEVDRQDQVKGYDTGEGRHVVLSPEELAAVVPDSDKTLEVSAFLRCADIDTTYLDRPYYLAPADRAAIPGFALIREAMRRQQVAAVARSVLFRRVRTLIIRAQGPGLVAETLNFDYEVRPARQAFRGIPEPEIEGEMLDLARHIIDRKSGSFDPATFEDRYDAALRDLVRAKAAGRPLPKAKPEKPPAVVSLLDALRASAGGSGRRGGAATGRRKASGGGTRREPPRRKAG
jgi:DNA end-binding protein Ku